MTLGLGIGLSDAWRLDSGGFFSGATLDMGFARGAYLGATPANLSVTRASTAYADDTFGNWTSFGSNVARITNKGLLVEESRTNSIRNNTMQGAAAGSPGTLPTNWAISATGLTSEVVAVGAENGVDYIDIHLSGTTGGTSGTIYFESNGNIAATNGQVWTPSGFSKLVAGSLGNITSVRYAIRMNDSGGANLGTVSSNSFTPNSTLTRYGNSVTLNQASTVYTMPGLLFSWSNGVAIDITIRIGWPQVELGAFVTSPIPTTGTAVTRAADSINLTFASVPPLTLYGEAVVNDFGTTDRIVAQLDDESNNNRLNLVCGASDGRFFAVQAVASVSQTRPANITNSSLNTTFKYIAALGASADAAAAANGSAVQTAAPASTVGAMTRLSVGKANSNGQLNGYLRRVACFPSRLSNAQLQALTT